MKHFIDILSEEGYVTGQDLVTMMTIVFRSCDNSPCRHHHYAKSYPAGVLATGT
jgi:hypothetical protein